MRRGQTSIYVILGIILLIITGTFFALRFASTGDDLRTNAAGTAGFAASQANLKLFVQSCLERVTLDAIDNYGPSDPDMTEAYIEYYINGCLNNFQAYRDSNFDITLAPPQVSVESTDNIVQVTMTYPVTLSRGEEEITVKDFQYRLRTTETVSITNGVLPAGTTLLGDDEDIMVIVEEDTTVTDADGNPVDSMSVKLLDKQFDGLNNDAVIGTVVYDGTPSGITFSPPLKVTIRLKKSDLPDTYDADAPKLGWYDEITGIWKTYPALSFEEDSDYYYYTAAVDHFTPLAIVGCGDTDSLATTEYPMGTMYQHIFEPYDEGYWAANSLDADFWDNENLDTWQSGRHLYPELMGVASCDAADETLTDHVDFVAEAITGNPQQLCEREGLLRDWDNDDDEEITTYDQLEDVEFVGYVYDPNMQGLLTQYTDNLKTDFQDDTLVREVSKNTFPEYREDIIWTLNEDYVTNYDGESIKQTCYDACKLRAQQDVEFYFSAEEFTIGYDPVYKTALDDLFDPIEDGRHEPIISGDGISDGLEQLNCRFPVEAHQYVLVDDGTPADPVAGNLPELQEVSDLDSGNSDDHWYKLYTITYDAAQTECIIPEENNNLVRRENIPESYIFEVLNVQDKVEIAKTMEKDEPKFYATPVSYGYGDITRDNKPRDDHVSGVGYFAFELAENGDACQDIGSAVESIGIVAGDDPVGFEEGVIESETGACVGDDSCTWYLNDQEHYNRYIEKSGMQGEVKSQGQLQAGLNIISVVYENHVDQKAVAQGQLFIRGKGLKEVESCGTTMLARHRYLTRCDREIPDISTQAGKEINCLWVYAQTEGVDRATTSVCDVDFDDDRLPDYCKEFNYGLDGASTNGGACVNGQMICPDVVNGDDVGCLCGSQVVVSEQPEEDTEGVDPYVLEGTAYCCDDALYGSQDDLEQCRRSGIISKDRSYELEEGKSCPTQGLMEMKGSACYLCTAQLVWDAGPVEECRDVDQIACDAQQNKDQILDGEECVMQCIENPDKDADDAYIWGTCEETRVEEREFIDTFCDDIPDEYEDIIRSIEEEYDVSCRYILDIVCSYLDECTMDTVTALDTQQIQNYIDEYQGEEESIADCPSDENLYDTHTSAVPNEGRIVTTDCKCGSIQLKDQFEGSAIYCCEDEFSESACDDPTPVQPSCEQDACSSDKPVCCKARFPGYSSDEYKCYEDLGGASQYYSCSDINFENTNAVAKCSAYEGGNAAPPEWGCLCEDGRRVDSLGECEEPQEDDCSQIDSCGDYEDQVSCGNDECGIPWDCTWVSVNGVPQCDIDTQGMEGVCFAQQGLPSAPAGTSFYQEGSCWECGVDIYDQNPDGQYAWQLDPYACRCDTESGTVYEGEAYWDNDQCYICTGLIYEGQGTPDSGEACGCYTGAQDGPGGNEIVAYGDALYEDDTCYYCDEGTWDTSDPGRCAESSCYYMFPGPTRKAVAHQDYLCITGDGNPGGEDTIRVCNNGELLSPVTCAKGCTRGTVYDSDEVDVIEQCSCTEEDCYTCGPKGDVDGSFNSDRVWDGNNCWQCTTSRTYTGLDAEACLCGGVTEPGSGIWSTRADGTTFCKSCTLDSDGPQYSSTHDPAACDYECHINRVEEDTGIAPPMGGDVFYDNGEYFPYDDTCFACNRGTWEINNALCGETSCNYNGQNINIDQYYCYRASNGRDQVVSCAGNNDYNIDQCDAGCLDLCDDGQPCLLDEMPSCSFQ